MHPMNYHETNYIANKIIKEKKGNNFRSQDGLREYTSNNEGFSNFYEIKVLVTEF